MRVTILGERRRQRPEPQDGDKVWRLNGHHRKLHLHIVGERQSGQGAPSLAKFLAKMAEILQKLSLNEHNFAQAEQNSTHFRPKLYILCNFAENLSIQFH